MRLNMEDFCQTIKDRIENYLSDAEIASIEIGKVKKNNGVELTALSIRETGANIAPNIYLDDYYRLYQEKGYDVAVICDDIARTYMAHKDYMTDVNMDSTYNKDNLFVKLVNYERNKELLQDTVYERYMDLAVQVRVLVDVSDNSTASSYVKTRDLEKIGISYEEAVEAAKENTKKLFPTEIYSMSEMLYKLCGIAPDNSMFGNAIEMYVITNAQMTNGAAAILDKDTLSEYFGTSDMIVFPSSTNEMIVVRDCNLDNSDYKHFAEMVGSINQDFVSEQEYLSDNIYRYDGRERSLSVMDIERDNYLDDEMGR